MTKTFFAGCVALLLASNAVAADFPINLSKAANMGFADEVQGDGKGGWSDQGPENDMRSFPLGLIEFEGVSFKIENPASNNGRAVLSFKHRNFPQGLSNVSLDLSKEKPLAGDLYLLHTSCWNEEVTGSTIGTIEIVFANGQKVTKEVRSGIDVADWWNACILKNGAVVVKKTTGSAGVYLSHFEFSKEPQHVTAVNIKSTGKALWVVAAATLSAKKIDIAAGEMKFLPGAEWRPVDSSDIQTKAGSALDLSGIVEAGPAGKHGRVIVSPSGELAFADSPLVIRRFRGSNSFWTLKKLDNGRTKTEVRERMSKFAELFHRSGYDIIRLLPIDAYLMEGAKEDAVYNSEKLDNIDWFMARLKENGIYSYLSIAAYRLGRADGKKGWLEVNSVKSKMFLGDPESRARWKACAERLLSHVNPYTGLAWKDDPAIAIVEPYNEQEFGMKLDKINDEVKALFERRWGDWLKNRFGTPVKLAEAAGSDAAAKAITSFASPQLPSNFDGFLGNEFAVFQRSLATECLAWYSEVLREIGYKGLISQYNMSKSFLFIVTRAAGCDVISNDGYFAHPSDVTRVGSKCPQGSSVAQAGYWRDIAATRLFNRPFVVNEHKHAFWNPYRHENALLFPAYSALQGFGAIMDHCDPALLEAEPNSDFITSYDPIAMSNEFVGGCLFRRGDVKRSGKLITLNISQAYIESAGKGIMLAPSYDQSKISLMLGFALDVETTSRTASLPASPIKPDLRLTPGSGSPVGGTAWFQSVNESKDSKFDLANFAKDLKRRGLLPAGNISSPENGVFQSDTGEIIMKTKEKFLSVSTPWSEGISLGQNQGAELACLKIIDSSVPASISICAVDGKTLASSSRIVLVYATDAVNSGMKLSGDRTTLLELGKLPVLMKSGKLRVLLTLNQAEGWKLCSLGLNGSRKEFIPVSMKNGKLSLEFDTSTLKLGATPFFELFRENSIESK